MFSSEFFPTPENVISQMLLGFDASGKTILEPSAGSGNIVSYLQREGAEVLACEKHDDLRKIVEKKCKVIEGDFFTVESHQVSHINAIVMNPPFSNAERHITHAWNIAPAGCTIISLCNYSTIENRYSADRKQLGELIERYGSSEDLGNAFEQADRRTAVSVGLIRLQKPADNYKEEFNGFFLDEEPQDAGQIGLMPYNIVRDLVNRYIEGVKIYDEQLNTAVKLNSIIGSFFNESLGFQCSQEKYNTNRNDFKKDLQKSAWMYIFDKMNMQKYATRGLKEDINKFVEQQTQIPFTMKNIYRMIEIVVGTTEQRMDKAILEAFDRVTEHHAENRHHLKGWKTNSHYLVNKKFILPYIISPAKEYGYTSATYNYMKNSYDGTIPDFEKALCFVTGQPYETVEVVEGQEKIVRINTVSSSISNNAYGEWYNSHFFRYKAYKNGNMHFEFLSDDVWAAFNSRVAKLKGYPLHESKTTSHKEKKERQRQNSETAKRYKPSVLFEIDVTDKAA